MALDTETSIALVVSAIPSVGLVVWKVVEWSFARNVKHEEDKSKKAETTSERHERELQELRASLMQHKAALAAEMSASGHKAEMSAQDSRTQLTQLAGSLGEVKGSLLEMREAFEEGREKQAQFYRAELAKTEQQFRQELSRALHPDLPDRVSKLEMMLPTKRSRK